MYHVFCRSSLRSRKCRTIRRRNFHSGSFYVYFLLSLFLCTMNDSRAVHSSVSGICVFIGVYGSDGFRCFTKCNFPQCLRDVHSYRYNVTYRYALCDSQVTFDANYDACTSYNVWQWDVRVKIKDDKENVCRMWISKITGEIRIICRREIFLWTIVSHFFAGIFSQHLSASLRHSSRF